MTITFLGKIAPATAGTPVPVTTDRNIRCALIRFEAIPTNTGKVYIGGQGLNKTTLAGVGRMFAVPTATGPVDGFSVPEKPGQSNVHTLADYYVDADVASEGVLVSYSIA